jgi:hypothetical protein
MNCIATDGGLPLFHFLVGYILVVLARLDAALGGRRQFETASYMQARQCTYTHSLQLHTPVLFPHFKPPDICWPCAGVAMLQCQWLP